MSEEFNWTEGEYFTIKCGVILNTIIRKFKIKVPIIMVEINE